MSLALEQAVCRHCYTNPRPTAAALPSFYTADYFNDPRIFPREEPAPTGVPPSRVVDIETSVP